jgi:formylglycine-generating enzyme required for sulfatase activity
VERFGGEREWYEWETPRHELTLPTYYIARYPVTVAQFRAFAEAGGYRERRYWQEAESVGHWQDGRVRRFYPYMEEDELKAGEEWGDAPAGSGELVNHPVVDVTWYEALAYCQWLAERLREWERMPEPLATLLREEGWVVTLPSEAEWEKAARGKDGREFPWGQEPDPNLANYSDTGIDATSAVGCFPGGVSPYGAEDMSGNVWEWCRTKWEENYEDYRNDNDLEGSDHRVLRGGAFSFTAYLVRCAFRFRYLPYYRHGGRGFRVVVAPFSPPSGR